jgi:hypothetical protein
MPRPRMLKKKAAVHHRTAMKLMRMALKHMKVERNMRMKAKKLAKHGA